MEALDLRTRPPRSPKVKLDGVMLLARTIDKARAMLPGGDLGPYKMPGLSATLMKRYGIDEEAFVRAVGDLPDESAIVAWWREHQKETDDERWNAFLAEFPPAGGDRETAVAKYPFLAERTDLTRQVDVLEEDDRRLYGTTVSA